MRGEGFCEFEDAKQGSSCDHADQCAGAADDVSGEMPPSGEEDRWEWWVAVGDGGLRDEGAEAEEVPGRRDVVAGFVPEVGEAEKAIVREIDRNKEERIKHPERDVAGGLLGVFSCSAQERHALVDGSAGVGELLKGDGAEGLLVLGEVVAEHVPEGLGLLRAKVDALEVFDGELVGALLAHGPEDEEEVPDAHTDLDAVGVAVAVVLGAGEFERGLFLLWVWVLRAHRISFGLSLCCGF